MSKSATAAWPGFDHGARVGLHRERCPLCDAARTLPQFEAGMASARARLSSLGSGVAQAREAVVQARRAHDVASARLHEVRAGLASLSSAETDLVAREAALSAKLGQHVPPGVFWTQDTAMRPP